MGIWSTIGHAASSLAHDVEHLVEDVGHVAVKEVGAFVSGGLGGLIEGGLEKVGIPTPIAALVAAVCDPRHATGELKSGVDEACKDLGIPDSLRKGLDKLVDKADELVEVAVTEGVGGFTREVGTDLGLLPVLSDSIALVVDAVTVNEGAASREALRLTCDAAAALGIPKSGQDLLQFGVDLVDGDTAALETDGVQVLDDLAEQIDMRPDLEDALVEWIHLAADVATGNVEALKKDGAILAGRIADDLPLPASVKTAAHLGIDLVMRDEDGARRAAVELAGQLGESLGPPEKTRAYIVAGAEIVGGDLRTAAQELGVPEDLLASAVKLVRNHDLESLKDLGKTAAQDVARKLGLSALTYRAGIAAIQDPGTAVFANLGKMAAQPGAKKPNGVVNVVDPGLDSSKKTEDTAAGLAKGDPPVADDGIDDLVNILPSGASVSLRA